MSQKHLKILSTLRQHAERFCQIRTQLDGQKEQRVLCKQEAY